MRLGVTFRLFASASPGHLMSPMSLHPYSGDIVRKHSSLASLTCVLPFRESVLAESGKFSTYHTFLSEQTPGRLGLLQVGPEANPSEMDRAPA